MRRGIAVAKIVFALVLLVVLTVGFLFYRALPEYSGGATLPGLSAQVRVWRDGFGVPHIFAENMNDGVRALGYLHAGERLYQMEISRRVGEGRLAEMLGTDMVDVDKFLRALGPYRLAQASIEALSPEARGRLKAYADGVNAYLASHRLSPPVEFLILGVKPERWQIADSLVWGKLMAWQLSRNHAQEIARARLAKALPADQAAWLMPRLSENSPVTTLPERHADHAGLDDPEAKLAKWFPFAHGASNEWAIAGALTESGKPILANDPHLELGAPILWYLARIDTPDESITGASVPGLPAFPLGHNRSIAWGITSSQTDTQDLFVETVDPANPANYLTPDGPRPFATRDEVIHVKGAPDVKFTVRATRHGPVMSDVSPEFAAIAGAGQVVALGWTGLGDHDTTAQAMFDLGAAHNWDDFVAALRNWQTPMQNFAYADVNGDIGLISPGLVPLRKSGDGLAPVDGASGAGDWTGMLPFEQLPEIHNPSAGFLFNANNALVPPDQETKFGVDWEEPYRARRLQQFFNHIDKHSLDTSAAMQADRVSLDGLEFKPLLKTVEPTDARARQALDLLAAWNGVMDKERPEPLIYTAFVIALRRILIEERLDIALGDNGPFNVATLLTLIKTHPAWCDLPVAKDRPDPDCRRAMARALDEGLAFVAKRQGDNIAAWRWGAEHVALLQHKVFSRIPLLSIVSDLSAPSSGGFYTLDRGGSYAPPADNPFARTEGGGFRGLYDLADLDRSRFMIATGESGHIFSSHYGDLAPLWNDVQSFEIAGSEADFQLVGADELTLSPK